MNKMQDYNVPPSERKTHVVLLTGETFACSWLHTNLLSHVEENRQL
jgi:hypothetical protein